MTPFFGGDKITRSATATRCHENDTSRTFNKPYSTK